MHSLLKIPGRLLFKLLNKSLNVVFTIYSRLLVLINKNDVKILVYTDSRGFNVAGKLGKMPFKTYISYLARHYQVEYRICPEKFTTIVDFLNFYNTVPNKSEFSAVVLHCGVVDFSPRPLSNIEVVKKSKEGVAGFEDLFIANATYHKHPFNVYYRNELTTTIYSKEYFKTEIIPKLTAIENLIWIDSNHFVKGWDGNYLNGRPTNIDQMVSEYDELLGEKMPNRTTLKNWTDTEIKKFTIDNIHFTGEGFKKLFIDIHSKIKEIIND
ncbi:hypothetical protein IDJ77_14530 [Mucilaginibacter sp. ZT4R22]|uniref:Lysophospholipase L1-like esterase n=1 Tax=Mucilaginibacter pankratovii TaxID=2772110 RepID=A0ABR7WRU7_9SPHI|nr:hypothetical protein [Mucilaginibacter pankratovii]MBD1365034.1 hypothetical protein [Mucilaginibacter pankratovii]